MNLSRDFQFIHVISFVINLYSILLIDLENTPKISPTNQTEFNKKKSGASYPVLLDYLGHIMVSPTNSTAHRGGAPMGLHILLCAP
jgi:hypothetical protein